MGNLGTSKSSRGARFPRRRLVCEVLSKEVDDVGTGEVDRDRLDDEGSTTVVLSNDGIGDVDRDLFDGG